MKKVKKVKKLPGVPRKKHTLRKKRISGGPDISHEMSKTTVKNLHR